jgi:hypothetical protein
VQGIKKQRIGDGTAAEQAPAGAPQQVGGGAAVGTATAAAGDTPGGAAGDGKLVLIWDLDETLLIFNSLLTGAWAATHPGQGAAAAAAVLAAGARWEVTILGLCDAHFFFDQVREHVAGQASPGQAGSFGQTVVQLLYWLQFDLHPGMAAVRGGWIE